MNRILLLFSIISFIISPIFCNDEEESDPYAECLINYVCVVNVNVDNERHHCNKYRKMSYVCENGDTIPIEDEFYEPNRDEENEIAGAVEVETDIERNPSEDGIVGVAPILVLITPCQRRYAPDQLGICRELF